MKKSEKTRNQLLFTVAFLSALSIVIAGICFLLFQRIHEIYKVSNSVHKIFEHYTSAANNEEVFLYKETTDPEFMGSEESFSTKSFRMHLKAMHMYLDEMSKQQNSQDLQINQDIVSLTSEICKYETLFTFASNKADEEGMDNFGTSIQFKRNEFELEQKAEMIGLTNVLTLEKIEKDYLLKNDISYIKELENKVESINADISQNKAYDFQQKVSLIKLLHDFRFSFLELVKSNGTMGFKNEMQLNDHILKSKENINKHFVAIEKKLSKKEQYFTSNIENVLLIFIINIVTLTIFVLYVYTRKTTKTISKLSTMNEGNDKVFEIQNSAIAS